MPVDVGVNVVDLSSRSDRTAEGITRVGTAEPGFPFYLPLWGALRREAVAVSFSSSQTDWSTVGVRRVSSLLLLHKMLTQNSRHFLHLTTTCTQNAFRRPRRSRQQTG
jgi:hypothetical protein